MTAVARRPEAHRFVAIEWSMAQGNGEPDFTEARALEAGAGAIGAVVRSWHHPVDFEQAAYDLVVTMTLAQSADPANIEMPRMAPTEPVEIEVAGGDARDFLAWRGGDATAVVGLVADTPVGMAWRAGEPPPRLA